MKIKVPICPQCKKELQDEVVTCPHCSQAVGTPIYVEVVSWPWSDRFLLFAVVLLFTSFFLPWFPGSFLSRDQPLSAFSMLLNLYNIDVGFLKSFNILRMVQMVPLLSIMLFFLVYLGDNVKKTYYPNIFIFIIALFGSIPFFFHNFSSLTAWLMTIVFTAALLYYNKRGIAKGSLEKTSYYMFVIFFLMSLFIYFLNLNQTLYVKLETIHINDTYGFWTAWFITAVMVVVVFLRNMRSMEDFWLLLSIFVLSIIAYSTVVEPLFTSGALRCFADNYGKTGVLIVEHLKIVGIAMVIAILSGIPIGVYITRHPSTANIVLYISSILITIPSIAMFGFMMPILSSIDRHWDAVQGIGIGTVPAVCALALYSLLPIIRNTYIALKSVDQSIIEAGIGMGMKSSQLLLQVELPLSASIIMAGVKTSVVMGVAIAALAAYIGAGGLGQFVVQGLQLSTNNYVLAGAISMGLLAIVCDIFLGKAEDWITPEGLKVRQAME